MVITYNLEAEFVADFYLVIVHMSLNNMDYTLCHFLGW